MNPPDSALLRKWNDDRDAEAFRLLVERHSSRVFATALRVLKARDRAEDVTQESFLELARTGHPGLRSVPAWLHRITTNRAISLLRSEKRRRKHEESWQPTPREESEWTWKQVEAWIDEAIEGLPEKQRVPLVEHFLEGRSRSEISRDLGVSADTVGYRLRGALEKIRGQLRRKGLSVPSALLLSGLESWRTEGAVALPAGLQASLGKIALGGPLVQTSALPGLVPLILQGALMKTTVATVLSLIVLALLLWGVFQPDSAPESSPSESGSIEEIATVEEPPPAPEPESAASRGPEEAPDASPEEPSGDPPGTIEIRGRVVGEDSSPSRGATVLLTRQPPEHDPARILWNDHFREDFYTAERTNSTQTGEDGRFTFKLVPALEKEQVLLVAAGEDSVSRTKYLDLSSVESRENVELTLEPGRRVRGKVLGTEGQPVSQAVVSVYHAYNKEEQVFQRHLAITDEGGEFLLTAGQESTHLTLRVNSEKHGQRFFIDLALSEEPLVLRYPETGTISGTITWTTGQPAAGLQVVAVATVPEAPTLVSYSGWRVQQKLRGDIGADGSYRIEKLLPGFKYNLYVIDASLGERLAHLHPMSPRYEHHFEIQPGDELTWDLAVARQIRITGTVTTAVTESPVKGARISVRRDGKELFDVHGETDENGRYAVIVNQGPGRYLVTAVPRERYSNVGEFIAEKFGHELDLVEGETLELPLKLHEPILFPVKILDSGGAPIESIRFSVKATLPNGKRFGLSSSDRAPGGLKTFEFHFPVKSFQIELGAFRGGPGVKLEPVSAEIGQEFPVREVSLPPAREFRGRLLDGEGKPRKGLQIQVEVSYRESERERIHLRTDDEGRFSRPASLRHESLTLEIVDRKTKSRWEKEIPGGEETIDLGDIRLEPQS